jgi:hypothetical protein
LGCCWGSRQVFKVKRGFPSDTNFSLFAFGLFARSGSGSSECRTGILQHDALLSLLTLRATKRIQEQAFPQPSNLRISHQNSEISLPEHQSKRPRSPQFLSPASPLRQQPVSVSWICRQQRPSHRFSRISQWRWILIQTSTLIIGPKTTGERP